MGHSRKSRSLTVFKFQPCRHTTQ